MERDRPAKEYQDHRDIHRIARKAIQPDEATSSLGRRPGRESTVARHVEISNGPQQQDHSDCERKEPKWIERVETLGAQATTAGTANATMPGSSRTAKPGSPEQTGSPAILCDTFRPVRRASRLQARAFTEGSLPSPARRRGASSTDGEDAPVPGPEQQVPVAAFDAGLGIEPRPFDHRRRGCRQRAPGGTGLAVGGTGTMSVVRQSMAFANSCASMAGIPSIRNPISPTWARSRPAGSSTSGIGPCIRLAACAPPLELGHDHRRDPDHGGLSVEIVRNLDVANAERVEQLAQARGVGRHARGVAALHRHLVRTAPFGRTLASPRRIRRALAGRSGESTRRAAVFEDLHAVADQVRQIQAWPASARASGSTGWPRSSPRGRARETSRQRAHAPAASTRSRSRRRRERAAATFVSGRRPPRAPRPAAAAAARGRRSVNSRSGSRRSAWRGSSDI